MTTAHRPTFHAAVGGKEQGGGRYISGVTRTHVHDLPGQLSIKQRQPGQGTADEVASRDELRAALEARETEHLKAIGKAPALLKTRELPPLLPPADDDDDDDDDDDGPALLIDPEDADDRPGVAQGAGGRAGGAASSGPARAAAVSSAVADDSDDDEEEDDDDEDDEEELMRELERIKKERAAEAAKKEREATDEAAAERDSSILQANPLLDPARLGTSSGASFAVKRRWDDDVVFKNQSREPKREAQRFINDTVRNDFHKRFLTKYFK